MMLWLEVVATLTGAVSGRVVFTQWGWSTKAKSKVENDKSLRKPRVMWRA
jgi:hypothetical protein